MKKITKLLLMTAIAIGMVACSNDDVPQTPESLRGTTYASIAVKLPNGPSTRAALTETWKGLDSINTITVFLVNETLGTIDHSTFGTSQFDAIDADGVLKPNLAVKATPGEKVKAYVVLNGNSDVLTTLTGTTPGAFAGVYATAVAKNASDLAKNEAGKDVIMMTNTVDPVEKEVKPGVSKGDAMAGSVNTCMVDVERVVSRAIVTAKADAKVAEIKVQNAQGTDASTITIKDLKYVVGQSNNQFYMIKQADYVTPSTVYDHVPSATVPWNPALFDNAGLEKSTKVETAAGTALDDFLGALTGEGADSKFVLPVTHLDANYRKGNTTFFEVIATFTPSAVNHGDGTPYEAGVDVFLGMKDGLFYSTRELAEAQGQKATMYKGTGTAVDEAERGAIMKYVLWLNPNEIPGAAAGKKATMSPTVRNQVYHAHIKGFKQIGLPNNPLNPTDPMNPDPDKPDAPGNENPINPIKPEDPLQTDDTYLSVQITVRPWGIHSYEIELGNDY
jgi:hypothetical protein